MARSHLISSFLTTVLSIQALAVDGGSLKKEDQGFVLPPEKQYLTQADFQALEKKSEKIEIVANEYTKKLLKHFHIEMKMGLAASSYERNILDMTQSYFGLIVGDKVDEALNNFGKYAKDRQLVVGLNVRASVVPLILQDYARKEINKEIYEKVKKGAVAAATFKVQQGFEKQIYPLIGEGKLTPEEYQAMLATNIEKTKTAVEGNDALIQKLAAPFQEEADERVDQAVDEFLFQEVSVKFAWSPNSNDSIIIFGDVGKAIVNGNFKQELRAATAFGGWANIGNTTQGTGEVHLGVQSVIRNDIKLTLESWVFHNRLPVRSGQTYLFNVTTMSPEAFKNQVEFSHLDSNMQKITIERPSRLAPTKDTVYFSTGDFAGNRAYSAGVIVRVLPKISIEVEGSTGRNALYKGALVEAILYHVNDALTFYVSNENVKDLMSAYNVAYPKVKPGQLGSASIGSAYTVGKWKLIDDVTAAINANIGLHYFYQNDGMYNQDDFGVDGGLTGQINWQ